MDKYNLNSFIIAQNVSYDIAIKKVIDGCSISQYLPYIFPKIEGIGRDYISILYGISNIEEAKEYLNHSVLGTRLIKISLELLKLNHTYFVRIFGLVDSKALKSSMTLFSKASAGLKCMIVFKEVLEKYFKGEECERTIIIINSI